MRRLLCIWFPNWPLQRLCVAQPKLKHRPVALYEQRRGRKIVACSQVALERGIVPGMPVAEAPGIHLEEYQPAADRAALELLAQWCEEFSPIVGLEDAEQPESLLLDITGTSSLFGDEQSLAEQVAKGFWQRKYAVRLAIADTLGAAWATARQANPLWIVPAGETVAALSELPVALLRISDTTVEVLAALGIWTIGQLLELPRSALAGRFEPLLIQRLHQALGLAPEQIVTCRAMPEIVVERRLEYPVDRRETIAFLLSQLIEQVTAVLAERQQGAIRLECQLDCEASEAARFEVGLFRASAQARHLQELVQTRLERLEFPGPVVAVRLAVTLAARLQSRQRQLFNDDNDTRRELALLVDRLSCRLGREAVVRAALVPDAQPEFAYRYEPLAGSSQRSRKELPGAPHRPLLVEPRPVPLEVVSVVPDGPPIQVRLQGRDHRVAESWGPERIQTGWWRGGYIRRDYYRVVTTEGNRFWIFRRRGEWFLHGVFD